MRLEVLGKLKYSMASSGIELANFRLVTYHLNKLCYHVTTNEERVNSRKKLSICNRVFSCI
jgi:hypothetical protein